MTKSNKFLLFLVITILLFTPFYVNAEPEENNTNPPAEENNTGGENNSSGENNTGGENNSSGENNTGGENNSSGENNTGGENNSSGENNTSGENNSSETNQPAENNSLEISLNQTQLELGVHKEATLKATITPSSSDAEIEWSSSDETVATVDNNGKVTTKEKAATVIITAKIKNSDDKKATCTIKVTRQVGKDATLKSLTITNGSLDKTFKSSVYEYSVTVDSKVNSLKFKNLKGELNDSNAGYLVTGNNNLKDGNVVSIIVTAEDKTTTKTYKLTIVKDVVSLDLKSLKINGYTLNEVFDKEKFEYTASIPFEIETLTVQAVPENSDNTVKISGNTNLKVGENTINIIVKDDSGNSKNYQIVVTREKEVSLKENPTSIITSNITSNSETSNITNSSSSSNDDGILKYAIVSLACLILFAIGGIGIYFYLKTSPKKLKKELNNMEQPKPNPIVEVEDESKNQINIEQMMQEDLVKTKEFNKEDLKEIVKIDDLFDDDEDV